MTLEEFDIFFHDTFNSAYGYACKYVDADTAEDVVQFAFITLWRMQDDVKDKGGFVFKCVRNKCFDILKRKKIVSIDQLEDAIDVISEEDERLDLIMNAIECLNDMQKKVIRMFAIGYNIKDISLSLGVSIQTVKNNKSIAISKIKSLLNK